MIANLVAAVSLTVTVGGPAGLQQETLVPSNAVQAHSQVENSAVKTEVRELRKYIRGGEAGLTFDVQSAIDSGATPQVVEAGRFYNQLKAGNSWNQNTRMSLPVWGNWCGPKHGGGEAVDTLDAICRDHDHCYANEGYFDCDCDQKLLDAIDAKRGEMGFKEAAMAIVIYEYFVRSPCKWW